MEKLDSNREDAAVTKALVVVVFLSALIGALVGVAVVVGYLVTR